MSDIHVNVGCFILAGGEGSRLQNLTKNTCKPLVKICSHYHLIDFSLINCLTSGVLKIAVIVQYESIDLIKYLYESNMKALTTQFNVLPPETRQTSKYDIVYKNTAHSVMVNLDYMDEYVEDILILSADHVYSMNYDLFYQHHLKMENDLTVSVMNVHPEEVSRFGVFTLDDDDNIVNFEEKPENPKSTLVSMGIYLFKKEKLIEALDVLIDEIGPELDFGKHVLPYFLKNYKVGVYKFKWYWLDLGTIDAFWKLNMQILKDPSFIRNFFEFDSRFTIENEPRNISPPYMSEKSKVISSLIGKNTFIGGTVENSVIGNDVLVKEGAFISKSVIMDHCSIKSGVTIKNAVISQNNIIEEDVICSEDNIICK